MSSYPTIRNPLLPSPPLTSSRSGRFRKNEFLSTLSLSTTATLKTSMSAVSIRGFMDQTINQISNASSRIGNNRRIMPTTPSSKFLSKSATGKGFDVITKSTSRSKIYEKRASDDTAVPEPLVHYNGPLHTLESLPVEKLNWIKDEPASAFVKNPLTNYNKSIVLRKPMTRSQTFPNISKEPINNSIELGKPKAMFYLRVLQVIATDSAKSRLFRCGIQVNQETCLSSYAASEKTGKQSAIAQFDETFLFDVDGPTTATISIYSQPTGGKIFSNRANKQNICLGSETINISMHAKSKTTERFVVKKDFKSGQSGDVQLLVVYGTYLSRRTQNMLNNTILFEDYITAYVRTGMVPRWDRFWGVLRGVQFELYDFEYKENRPPLHIIPLDNFITAFDISEENEEELSVEIGSRGIALQFAERAIQRHERHWMGEDLEYRMYLLPESPSAAREWENNFNYVGTIFDEIRGWDENSTSESSFNSSRDAFSYRSSDFEEEEEYYADGSYTALNTNKKLTVPLKLMW